MNDSDQKRVQRLIRGRLNNEELIFLVGMTTNMMTERAQQFVVSGQFILVATSADLLKAGPQSTSLVLVHDRDVVKEVSKLPGKVEFVDLGVLKKIIVEVTDENLRLLTVEREADKALERAQKSAMTVPVSAKPALAGQPDPMKDFALKFFAEADKHGVVSTIVVQRLVAEVEGLDLSNAQLAKAGWLEPWRRPDAQKVGGYTATDKLQRYQVSAPVLEPGNAFERAQFLVASEPDLRQRLESLKDEIAEIEVELGKVEKAKAWLNQGQHF